VLAQEPLFFRHWPPAEDRVPMRKTAEARDRVAVALGPAERLAAAGRERRGRLGGEAREAFDRTPLELDVFAVLQGEIEEGSLDDAELPIDAGREPVEAEASRDRIAGKCLRPAAMDVTRELIDQEDEREPATCRIGPAVQLAGDGAGERVAETVPDLPIRLGTYLEPAARHGGIDVTVGTQRAEPVSEDVFRAHAHIAAAEATS